MFTSYTNFYYVIISKTIKSRSIDLFELLVYESQNQNDIYLHKILLLNQADSLWLKQLSHISRQHCNN